MKNLDIRNEFPILNQEINGYPLVYLDNAATTQKPLAVTEAIADYYRTVNSNIHRGVHHLSQQATSDFEAARECVKRFMGAGSHEEIIFTKGTTESVNLVASGFAKAILSAQDSVLVTVADHHSLFVPWQQACLRTGAKFEVLPVEPDGTFDLNLFERKLRELKPKIVALPHISNVLGIVNPIKEMTATAHAHGAAVLVDGAQSIAHCPVDVTDLDCDFFCWSGHKAYGPTGIGVLFGKREWLERLPPWQFGGEMIDEVGLHETTFAGLPFKFEAGTPPIAEAIALKPALEFIERIGFETIQEHERHLLDRAADGLERVKGLKIYGTKRPKSGVLSFTIQGAYHYDIGVILDQMGIAVRTGHHCAQPLMKHFGIPGTVRCSFALYNIAGEVDRMLEGLDKAVHMLI